MRELKKVKNEPSESQKIYKILKMRSNVSQSKDPSKCGSKTGDMRNK